MRLLILLLLFLISVHSTLAVRPSHRAPVIFAVTTEAATNGTEHRGTSMRSDGQWLPGHVTQDLEARVRAVFPLSTLLTINTDDEVRNLPDIKQWMMRECTIIQRRSISDCFVLSAQKNYEPFKSALDPYDFRRWESSLKRVVRHALEPLVDVTPLGTLRPTMPITPSPVVPDACESRLERDCVAECEWYGVFFKCHKPGFCGFSTKMACEHYGCQFIRNRCRPLSGIKH